MTATNGGQVTITKTARSPISREPASPVAGDGEARIIVRNSLITENGGGGMSVAAAARGQGDRHRRQHLRPERPLRYRADGATVRHDGVEHRHAAEQRRPVDPQRRDRDLLRETTPHPQTAIADHDRRDQLSPVRRARPGLAADRGPRAPDGDETYPQPDDERPNGATLSASLFRFRSFTMRLTYAAGAMIAGLVALTGPGHAQPVPAIDATWVSATVGDDDEDCSFARPCRTFANAIAKTNPNGVMTTLEPGDYGPSSSTNPSPWSGAGCGDQRRQRDGDHHQRRGRGPGDGDRPHPQRTGPRQGRFRDRRLRHRARQADDHRLRHHQLQRPGLRIIRRPTAPASSCATP